MDHPLAQQGAQTIRGAYRIFQEEFTAITRRAPLRFEARDWHGLQADAGQRLDLYASVVKVVVADLRQNLGEHLLDKALWEAMKRGYSASIASLPDAELAETFFNSVTRRIFTTVGVDPKIEFVDSDFDVHANGSGIPVYRSYPYQGPPQRLLLDILQEYPFEVGYAHPEQDAVLVARVIDAHLAREYPGRRAERIELLANVFYRSQGAYLIGRICLDSPPACLPLVLCLRNEAGGVTIDAVLLTEDETSILFSFTRSYFHVEVTRPHELVGFLKTIMPLKRIAELYISIGYNKHGKTELYRDLLRHLEKSTDQFELARGEKGMVMLVFTLPSYGLVFKVIRDRFAEPKSTTRQEVMDRYQLVFKHDRAGRLVDAQEFEYLTFEKSRFSEALLGELLARASSSVQVNGEQVSIRQLYVERRLAPLNLYVQEAGEQAACEAVLDYGQAIKDLAATNIFPGDILLKNFGVTRHGRVVFYDYDELTLLTECKFRRIPQGRDFGDDFEAEPWFYVGKDDIFPEEFSTFLGLTGRLREVFERAHADLFGVEYWKAVQERHLRGEALEILPYKESRRLDGSSLA